MSLMGINEEGWRQVLSWNICEQGGLLQLAGVISQPFCFQRAGSSHKVQHYQYVSVFLSCAIESRLLGVFDLKKKKHNMRVVS